MKKFVKFFAIAAVAAGMMTLASCGETTGPNGKPMHKITVKANDNAMGTVTGEGKYEEGTEVTISATPKSGFVFTEWAEDHVKTATRTIIVAGDATYTANFAEASAAPAGVNVTFGNNSWTSAYTEAYNVQGMPYFMAFSNADQQTFPVFAYYGTSVEPGTYSDSFNEDAMSYNNNNFYTVDYYEEYALQSTQGSTYGDWWAKTATVNVTSYDATTMQFVASISAVMFSALEAFVGDNGTAVGMDAASTQNLSASVNQTLVEYTGKAIKAGAKKL